MIIDILCSASLYENVNPQPEFVNSVSIHDNAFVVFFPDDAHQPYVTRVEKMNIKKVVVKIAAV